MTELRQKLKDFEAELSAMVMEFHTANNIDPLLYKISPVFRENKRANGDRLIFVRHDVVFSHQDIKQIVVNYSTDYPHWVKIRNNIEKNMQYYTTYFQNMINPLLASMVHKVDLFCAENDIRYIDGEVNYIAHNEKILQFEANLMLKP